MTRFVFFTSLPDVGGHTTITLALARLSREMFDDMLVIAKEMPGHGTSADALAELQAAGIATLVIRGDGSAGAPRTLFDLARSPWRRPDAFLAMGMRHLSPTLCLALRARRSIYYHITHEISPKMDRMLGFYSQFFDRVAFISPTTERVWKKGRGRNAATFSITQPSEVQLELDDRRRRDDPIRFGFIGRLSEGKGCLVLLRFAESGTTPCSLRVAGDGELASAFERTRSLVEGPVSVRFDGPFSPAARQDYLGEFFSDIDYLVVPSQDDREGIPTAILEALGAGVPVIATRTGGMRAFDDPEFGWPEMSCVTLVDKEELESALELLARRPRPPRSLQTACREYYGERFSDRALLDAWRRALGATVS